VSKRYKLSPELTDGEHYAVVDTPEQLCEAVKAWCEEAEPPCGFCVEAIEMSQETADELQEL